MVPYPRAEASGCVRRMMPGSRRWAQGSTHLSELVRCGVYSLPLSGLRASFGFPGAILFEKRAREEVCLQETRSSLLEGWTPLCGVLRTRR